MDRRGAAVLAALGCAIALVACREAVGLVFGDLGVLSGGYGSGGNAQQFGYRLPQQFEYLYPAFDVGRPFDCETDAHCGLAGRTTEAGSVSNGGESFIFISTANLPASYGHGERTVRASGIITRSGGADDQIVVPDAAELRSLRLVLEWAFLTARFDPAAFDDSAVVRITSGDDSAVVFRVTSADLQSGRFPRKAGGCGTHALVGRDITYGTCTDWRTSHVDITAWKDRPFRIQFVVGEAGTPVTGTEDLPTTFLFRRAVIEGGR
jgi:hypothetical protein